MWHYYIYFFLNTGNTTFIKHFLNKELNFLVDLKGKKICLQNRFSIWLQGEGGSIFKRVGVGESQQIVEVGGMVKGSSCKVTGRPVA